MAKKIRKKAIKNIHSNKTININKSKDIHQKLDLLLKQQEEILKNQSAMSAEEQKIEKEEKKMELQVQEVVVEEKAAGSNLLEYYSELDSGVTVEYTDNIIFTLESWGQLSCKQLLETSAEILIEKAKELEILI